MKKVNNHLFESCSPYIEEGNKYQPRIENMDIIITNTGWIGFYHELKHIGVDRLTKLKAVTHDLISKNITAETAKILAVTCPLMFYMGNHLSFKEPYGYYELKLQEE